MKKLRMVSGQPSWRIATREVEAFVTRRGGHLGPVTFDRAGRRVQPYAVAPWCREPGSKRLIPLLHALRGDFFCLPFGGNGTPFRGEGHPPHGETANADWQFESCTGSELHLSMCTKVRAGRVDKRIRLCEGHQAVYLQHVISGMRGPMSLGHHAMLKFPDELGSGAISTSPFVHGQVCPGGFEKPEQRGYCALQAGAVFDSLARVPLGSGGVADVSRYPARRGFEDMLMLVGAPDAALGWTAVTFPRERYVWFALKDPRVLRQTILWISNGGRHYAPWNGRHVNVMGLEEVTAYFADGLAPSARPNALTRRGYATSLMLNPRRPTVVNYIMAVAAIPAGFTRVVDITAAADRQSVVLRGAGGRSVRVPLDAGFLQRGAG